MGVYILEFRLNPRRIAAGMLIVIALLAAMHVAQLCVYYYVGDPDVFDFLELIDFDYEANLPSLYSSLAILFCAVLLWLIAVDKKASGEAYRYHWLGLAVIFTFLGVDEAISLHEEIGDLVEAVAWFEAAGYLFFAWVVPYGMLLVVFAVIYFKFVLSLPRKTMLMFVVAGCLFIFGAVGIEIISAREADLHGSETVYYSVLYTLEELCEMIAIVLFSNGLLRYMEAEKGAVIFRIGDAEKE
jgi:hypothetical protein